jgi:alpha-tubulin suppressor-like RCC1 family protein
MRQRLFLVSAVLGSVTLGVVVAACVGDSPVTGGVVLDGGAQPDSSTPGTDSGGVNTTDSGGGTDAGGGGTDAATDGSPVDAGCTFPASPYLQDAVQVAVGSGHACAIRTDGSLVCWGDNTHGQLGVDQGMYPTSAKPITVPVGPAGNKVLKVVATDTATMAIDGNHHVWTWGSNGSPEGLLGQGITDQNAHPVPTEILVAANPIQAADIAVGWYHACVVTTSAAIYCWGQNLFGQITPGNPAPSAYPSPTQTYSQFGNANTKIFSGPGSYATCVIDPSGQNPRCWGLKPVDGVVVTGSAGDTVDGTFEAEIADGGLVLPIKSFTVGNDSSCLLDGNNHVGCGGANDSNMLDPSGNKAQYTIAAGLGATAQVAHGYMSICTLDQNGAAHCWGANNLQQLGKGGTDTATSGVPATVVGVGGAGSLSKITSIASGFDNVCAILQGACPGGGPVVCWGDNTGSQLGRADAGASSGTPEYVQAP